MSDSPKPVFLVDAYSDPVILKINGRASYLNCGPVGRFFSQVVGEGRRNMVVDFSQCTGMDSTFLGILAGAALEFRKMEPPGTLTLTRLGERNLELVKNLGLHRILHLDTGDVTDLRESATSSGAGELLGEDKTSANMILRAHENLVKADQGNLQKFQDVLSYLKAEAEKQEDGT